MKRGASVALYVSDALLALLTKRGKWQAVF